MARRAIALVIVAGCGGAASSARVATTFPACRDGELWDASSDTGCRGLAYARERVAAAEAALAKFDVDTATAALAGIEQHGLDHATHVKVWEQRGIAAAYVEDERAAAAAFERVLALDPGHLLSYTLSPKATFVFERVRLAAAERAATALDVSWAHGQRVGAPVPLTVEVLADPAGLVRRASVFVRERGAGEWRAALVPLARSGAIAGVTLAPVRARRATALEIYARGYDAAGNEVLAWADPRRPREIPLRYDPPTPWYGRWWVWAIIGGAVATGTGVAVYAAQPPDTVDAKTGVTPLGP